MPPPNEPGNMSASFNLAAGPLLIETSFGLLLAGIMVAQLYFYWSKYGTDSKWMKTLVYSVGILEIIHTGFSTHIQYSYFVVDVEDPQSVARIVWSGGIILVLEMLIVSLAQGFYTYRIWQLSHCYPATIIPAVTLFCRCTFGLATASLTYVFNYLLDFANTTSVIVTVNIGLTLAVVMDLMTTGLLIYYLHQKDSSIRRTKHIIHTLMFYTINTGAMTIVFSMLTLLTFNFVRSSFMFAGFVIIVTKVYANSMLAMLNARKRLKNTNGGVHSIPLSNRASCRRHAHADRHQQNDIHIEISQETVNDQSRCFKQTPESTDGIDTKSVSYALV